MSRQRISLGKQGEDIAADFLKARGFLIVDRNYRQKSGEIDIICKDRNVLVFIEVKTRSNRCFGHPLEAVDRRKQRQISVTALDYLSRNRMLDEPVRFDVVGVIINHDGPELTHIVNAFEPC